jgi:hypothetical protein
MLFSFFNGIGSGAGFDIAAVDDVMGASVAAAAVVADEPVGVLLELPVHAATITPETMRTANSAMTFFTAGISFRR